MNHYNNHNLIHTYHYNSIGNLILHQCMNILQVFLYMFMFHYHIYNLY